MKKKLLILAVISSILLSGCSNNKVSDIRTDIPDTLIVDADLPQDVPSNVSTYKVSYKNFDTDKLLELFNMNPVSSSGRDALGKLYYSGNSQLWVYDDEGVMHGGFSYNKNISTYISGVITTYSYTDMIMDKALDDFSNIKALDFFKNIGLEQLKVDRAYEISGEELQEFVKSSNDYEDYVADEINPEDTYTLLYLSQYIDDIPLADFPWEYGSIIATETTAEVLLFENQIIENRFINIYDVGEEIRNDEIISPKEAFKIFIDDYNKKLQLNTTTIENIVFKYIVTVDKKGEMYAQPAYIFEYERLEESENSPEPIPIEEKKVISARTGEFILSTGVGI